MENYHLIIYYECKKCKIGQYNTENVTKSLSVLAFVFFNCRILKAFPFFSTAFLNYVKFFFTWGRLFLQHDEYINWKITLTDHKLIFNQI